MAFQVGSCFNWLLNVRLHKRTKHLSLKTGKHPLTSQTANHSSLLQAPSLPTPIMVSTSLDRQLSARRWQVTDGSWCADWQMSDQETCCLHCHTCTHSLKCTRVHTSWGERSRLQYGAQSQSVRFCLWACLLACVEDSDSIMYWEILKQPREQKGCRGETHLKKKTHKLKSQLFQSLCCARCRYSRWKETNVLN